jgi:hypothetical protein
MSITGVKVGSGRRLYVGAAPETTFGSEATLTHCLTHPCDENPLEITQERMSNSGFASGNTSDHESGHIVIGSYLNKPLSLYATLEAIGIFLSKCMNGGDTKSGTTPTWVHDLAYAALPASLPGMTIEDHLSSNVGVAATDRKHLGVCIDSFEFTFSQEGRARIRVGTMGSGKLGTVGTITESGLVIPTELIEAPKCRVTMEACPSNGTTAWDGSLEVSATPGVFPTIDSAATDISDYIEEFTFRVLMGGVGKFRTGSSIGAGVNWSRVFPRARKVEVEFKAIYGSPLEALLHAAADSTAADQKEKTILLNIASDTANHGGAFAFPVCVIQPESPSGLSGVSVLEPSFKFESRVCAAYPPIVAKIADGSASIYA